MVMQRPAKPYSPNRVARVRSPHSPPELKEADMKLAKLKQKALKASVEGDTRRVAELRRKMFEKIFQRKEEGKGFKAKHIL